MIDTEQLKANFEFIKAETHELVQETYKLRYTIYSLERRFLNPDEFKNGRETDEYDVRSKHALALHRQSAAPVGSVRLILPDESNPKQQFPIERYCGNELDLNLLQHFQVPRYQIGELSRFGVTKQYKRRFREAETCAGINEFVSYEDNKMTTLDRRTFPYISVGLMALAFSLSKQQGITHWYAVMEPATVRFLQRFGMNFVKIGPQVEYYGLRQPVFASTHALLGGVFRARPDLWQFINVQDGIPDDFVIESDMELFLTSGTYEY